MNAILATKRKTWAFMGLLLYMPFLLEFAAYPLFMKIQPQWLAVALFFVCYTYLFYGAAIAVYHRWRKKTANPVGWRPAKLGYVLIALAAGVIFRRVEMLLLGETQLPMLILESRAYLRTEPLWMGVIGYLMQLVYYLFEFTLTACLTDGAQTAAEQYRLPGAIPWGGVFLGLTWGLGHALTKGDLAVGVWCALLSLLMGLLYNLLGKRPIYAFVAIAAAYLL